MTETDMRKSEEGVKIYTLGLPHATMHQYQKLSYFDGWQRFWQFFFPMGMALQLSSNTVTTHSNADTSTAVLECSAQRLGPIALG